MINEQMLRAFTDVGFPSGQEIREMAGEILAARDVVKAARIGAQHAT